MERGLTDTQFGILVGRIFLHSFTSRPLVADFDLKDLQYLSSIHQPDPGWHPRKAAQLRQISQESHGAEPLGLS